jgi:hypothetical protein
MLVDQVAEVDVGVQQLVGLALPVKGSLVGQELRLLEVQTELVVVVVQEVLGSLGQYQGMVAPELLQPLVVLQ